MKRRGLCILLSFLLMLQLLPSTVLATGGTSGNADMTKAALATESGTSDGAGLAAEGSGTDGTGTEGTTTEGTSSGTGTDGTTGDESTVNYTVSGVIYSQKEPVTDKTEAVYIDPETSQWVSSGITASFELLDENGKSVDTAAAFPDKTVEWRYMWCYSTTPPEELSLGNMLPISMGPSSWKNTSSQYTVDEFCTELGLALENPEPIAYDARSVVDYEYEEADLPELFYFACMAFLVDTNDSYACNDWTVLATGFNTGPCVKVTFTPQTPVTGISAELMYTPSDSRVGESAVGKSFAYELGGSDTHTSIYVSGADSNGKYLQYGYGEVAFLWFYGNDSIEAGKTADLTKMTPVGMKPADWQTYLQTKSIEDYISSTTLHAWDISYIANLPIKSVAEITGGAPDAMTGNDSAFTCCVVWKYDENVYTAITPGSVRVDFQSKAVTVNNAQIYNRGIALTENKGMSWNMTAALDNYEGTSTYQWYKAAADTVNPAVDTAIEGATEATYAAPLPDEPGAYYYYCAVTYTDDFGREVTLYSKVVKGERYGGPELEISIYGGRLDLSSRLMGTQGITSNYYPRYYAMKYTDPVTKTAYPVYEDGYNIAYQSVGSPITISGYYDIYGSVDKTPYDKTTLEWYVSSDRKWQNGTKIGEETRTDLLEIRDEANKKYVRNNDAAIENNRKYRNQVANLHIDLPASCATAVGTSYITLVTKTYGVDCDYPQTVVKTIKLVTLASNEDLYILDANNAIVKYIGYEDILNIPAEKNGTAITEIKYLGGEARGTSFRDGFASKIIIPEGITTIDEAAFRGLHGIREVQLPGSIRSIGESAFTNTGIETVNLPEGLQSIGSGAFSDTPLAGTLTLPKTLTKIDSSAFSGTAIEKLVFNADTFPILGTGVFSYCMSLGRVELPANASATFNHESDSTTYYALFEWCKALRSIANEKSIANTTDREYAIRSNFKNTIIMDQLLDADVDDASFRYTYNSESDSYEIVSVLNIPEDGVLSFPATYNGKAVTAIGTGYGLFTTTVAIGRVIDPLAVKSIVIPDSVKTIGANAFAGCKNLSGAIDMKNVNFIGYAAFQNCEKITAIKLLDNCRISDMAFAYCHSLASVTGSWKPGFTDAQYPETPTTQEYATVSAYCNPFFYTQAYESFWDEVTYTLQTDKDGKHTYSEPGKSGDQYWVQDGFVAWKYRYADSTAYGGYKVVDNAYTIIYYLKKSLPEDETIRVPAAVQGKPIRSVSASFDVAGEETYNIVFSEGIKELNSCSMTYAKSVTLPTTLTAIYGSIFKNNTALKEIVFPAALATLSGTIFDNCSGLESITFTTDSEGKSKLTEIGDYAFKNIRFGGTLTLPEGITAIGEEAFYGAGIKELKLPSTLKTIGADAFKNNYSNQALVLPEGLESIGDRAFYESGFVTVSFPSTLQAIGSEVFRYADITEVDLTNTKLTAIPANTFYRCYKLTKVRLGESITEIGSYAFANLADSYGDVASYGLQELTFGSKLKTIGNGAFYEARILSGDTDTGLTISLPDSVESIGESAFATLNKEGGFDLAEGRLPASLSSLGRKAFAFSGLTKVVIPEGLTVIPEGTFSFCDRLQTVVLHDNITEIGEEAFHNTHRKTDEGKLAEGEIVPNLIYADHDTEAVPGKVVLPKALKTLGRRALSAFIPKDVTIGDKVESISPQAFYSYAKWPDDIKLTLSFASKASDIPEIKDTLEYTDGLSEIHIWCWPETPVYTWAEDMQTKNTNENLTITIHEYGENLMLSVKLKDQNGNILNDTALLDGAIQWENTETDVAMSGEGWNLDGVSREGKYMATVKFSDEAYQKYDLPAKRSMSFFFDPSSEDFSRVASYTLKERTEITLAGTIYNWAYYKDKDPSVLLTVRESNREQTYTLTPDENGDFEQTIKRYPAVLSLTADKCKTTTVKDVQFYHIGEDGKADLGTLMLQDLDVRMFYDYEAVPLDQTGTLTLTKKANPDVSCTVTVLGYNRSLCIPFDMQGKLFVGDQVELTATPTQGSAYALTPYTFTIGALDEEENSKLTGLKVTERPGVKLNSPNAVVFLFDQSGAFVAKLYNGRKAYLSAGSYTAVLTSQKTVRSTAVFTYFSNFNGTLDQLQKDIKEWNRKVFSVNVEETGFTEISEAVPEFGESQIELKAELASGLTDKNGYVPLYLTYSIPEEELVETEGVSYRFKIVEDGRNEHHFVQIDGEYAFIDREEGLTSIKVTSGGGHADPELALTTKAASGTITVYVKTLGQQLKVYYGDTLYATVSAPSYSFTLNKPNAVSASESGTLGLTALYNRFCEANVYVDGELQSTTRLTSYGQGRNKLPYTLTNISANNSTEHSIYVEVVDSRREIIWSSDTYTVTHSNAAVAQPNTLKIRLINENAGADGVVVDQTQLYNFKTGDYPRLKTVIPYWNYNPDGTMAKKVTYEFSLSMENATEDMPVSLTLFCNEAELTKRNVLLEWNADTRTFDGSIVFPENSITANDLPYGFSVNYNAVVTEPAKTQSLEEALEERKGVKEDVDADMAEAKDLYQRIDVENLSMFLNSVEGEDAFTEQEKQDIIDYVLAWNELCDVYDEGSAAVLEAFKDADENNKKLVEALSGETASLDNAIAALNDMGVSVQKDENLTSADVEGFATFEMDGSTVYYDAQSGNIIDLENKLIYSFGASSASEASLMLADSESGSSGDGKSELAEALSDAKKYYDYTTASIGLLSNSYELALGITQNKLTQLQASFDGAYEKLVKAESALDRYNATYTKYVQKLPTATENVNIKDLMQTNYQINRARRDARVVSNEISLLKPQLNDLTLQIENLKAALMSDEAFGTTVEVVGAKLAPKTALAKFSHSLQNLAEKKAVKYCGYVGTIVSTGMTIFDTVSLIMDFSDELDRIDSHRQTVEQWDNIMQQAIDAGCIKGDSEEAWAKYTKVRDEIYHVLATRVNYATGYFAGAAVTSLGQIATALAALTGVGIPAALYVDLVLTTGSQACATFGTTQLIWSNEELSPLLTKLSKATYESIDLDCWDDCEDCGRDDGSGKDGDGAGNGAEGDTPDVSPLTDPVIDPAGIIYEGVLSNRVEGATATVYYKDEDGSAQSWDEAAIYGETNPQTTDKTGTYAWYTPIGKWLVKVTKDGYYDADSKNDPAAVDGWLPVPPPQMNVNIGMISKAAPAISEANAAAGAITVTFKQYMDVAQFTTSTGASELVTVTQNGVNIPVTASFTDAEESPTKAGTYYGRIMKLTRTDGRDFTGSGIVVKVDKAAKNYAETALASSYTSPALTAGASIGSIEHSYPNRYVTKKGTADTLSLIVLDDMGQPAKGIAVSAEATTGGILTLENASAVSDENGRVQFKITAAAAGDDVLTFKTAKGAQVSMNVRVTDVTEGAAKPEKPTANLSDYDTVKSGTQLVITAQEGMTIRYTTDNTCPCTDAALTYTGPITLTESGYYRIAAQNPAGEYSERLNLHIAVSAKEESGSGSGGNGGGSGSGDGSANRGDTQTNVPGGVDGGTQTNVPDGTQTSVPGGAATDFFVDVKAQDYFYDAVSWAAASGIAKGTSATEFSPGGACTRGQIVTFQWRAAGSPEPKSTVNPFTDVKPGAYYEKAVLWAVENGIVKGVSATEFDPDAICTRAQGVTFLYRAAGVVASGSNAFADVSDDDYYNDAVTWAERNEITGGIGGGLFGPANDCTRAQIVTFLWRAMGK